MAADTGNSIVFKTTLVLAGTFAVVFWPGILSAQTQPSASKNEQAVAVPSSASDILKLAMQMNGLDAGSAKPWHIKISYEEFDSDGDNVSDGTFEEFYFSPKKYKQIYSGDAFKQTEIATDSGLYHIGDQRWPTAAEYQVRNAVMSPLHAFRMDRPNLRLDKTEKTFNTGKMACLVLHSTGNVIVLPSPVACFQADTVMLRFLGAGLGEDMSYSSIVQFQGRYLAKEMVVSSDGKPTLKIHVDELGEITKVDDAFFQPPAAGTQITGRITTPPGYMDDYAISTPTPPYHEGMSGHVTVHMVVGKDGRVIEASASDGPKELQNTILKAVRSYQFRPYYILDQPVEVQFEYSFDYHGR